jgi:hypothetical protein
MWIMKKVVKSGRIVDSSFEFSFELSKDNA